MSLIIYPQPDNKLAIVYPAAGVPIEQVIATAVPPETEYLLVNEVNLVNELFDAYEFSLTGPAFNPAKGQEIQRNRWREARKPLLEALDVEYMRALERNDTAAAEAIAASKEALRDVTNHPLPNDPEGILATWPEILC